MTDERWTEPDARERQERLRALTRERFGDPKALERERTTRHGVERATLRTTSPTDERSTS